VHEIQQRLQVLIAQNNERGDLERMPLDEFVIDLERRRRIEEENASAAQQLRQQYFLRGKYLDLLARRDLPAGYPVGSFVMSASPLVAEAMGCAGFDWAVIDMEHTPLDLADLAHMLQAVAGTPMLPVTRVPWNDTVMVKRVLDAGAQTLLFPFVQDADEARKAVAACKYPPMGVRGMAAMSRGSRFGTVKDYFKVANAGVSVIAVEAGKTLILEKDRVAKLCAEKNISVVGCKR
jgi:hypothetical protein